MPVTDDEIREKYLERAIRELNTLTRELQACPHCPRGNLMPVLGSGHPQADIMLLKYSPLPSEIEEGVAFYGRAGRRADEVAQAPVDRSAGGVRHAVREVPAERRLAGRLRLRLAGGRGDRDRAAEDRRRDGRGGARQRSARWTSRSRARCSPALGEIQQLTPTIDALYVPNIDESLDEQDAKRAFWAAFRALGRLVRAPQPPY